VTLVSEDVDGWYDRLKGRGISIEAKPTLNPTFNIYHFFLRDPDGYLLEVQRFCDPTWPSPSQNVSD
jgi:catechol 2,3-dioxygenase-like lactoylglutathione lyase family enzyme